MLRAALVTALALAACSSQPTEPEKAAITKAAKVEPAKAEPKVDAKSENPPPAKSTATDAKAAPVADAKADPAVPATAPSATIVDDVLAQRTIAYAPKDGAIAYPVSGSVEGTGQLLTLVVRTSDGKKSELEICDADPECEATTKTKRDAIVAHMKDREWVPLQRLEWPDGAATLEGDGFALAWKGGKLEGKRPDGSAIAFPEIPAEKPHTPSPSAVYISKDHPIVVAYFDFDPGEAYGEGFNVFSDVFVALPPAAK